MKILFLSLLDFNTFEDRNIYSDLLREFIKNGHQVSCISPIERRKSEGTHLLRFGDSSILKLKIGNTQKTNLIEKGISTLLIEPQFIRGIKKYYADVKFDLVLYPTPPVTFANVIRYIKRRDGAKSYLMLKDIFPQSSLDLKVLKKTGLKGIIYYYFRLKEKTLYTLSDRIGCMSQANVDYVLKHNPEISPDKVEIFPNCIEPVDMRITQTEQEELRKKYGLPLHKKIFVYGGNLGKPQAVPFIVECLKACAGMGEAFFVIAGSGTDRHFLEEYISTENPSYVKLFGHLPKEEYDRMIACCDVGLIFLDHRFTIPNFPSRLLSYMQAGLPVLACTDPTTDIGQVVTDGGFGWWCESDNPQEFANTVKRTLLETTGMDQVAVKYLTDHYAAEQGYQTIAKSMVGQ